MYNKLYMFKVYCLNRFDVCIYPQYYHHNQDNKRILYSQKFSCAPS